MYSLVVVENCHNFVSFDFVVLVKMMAVVAASLASIEGVKAEEQKTMMTSIEIFAMSCYSNVAYYAAAGPLELFVVDIQIDSFVELFHPYYCSL